MVMDVASSAPLVKRILFSSSIAALFDEEYLNHQAYAPFLQSSFTSANRERNTDQVGTRRVRGEIVTF
ncbi:hypothetical protein SAMD00023353_0501710 [Rosellinia necatrix]|uniref:Uncharacterized protein n=1 Tax=Rosellinia necatrix TaxID=77044 RepID=A0A1S8A5Q8_ROSNE|nr:hypothetical protein SAMD00023353_0501710 [Rosellinia necatrix]